MSWSQIIWDHTSGGNAEHDRLTDEVNYVLDNFVSQGFSDSSGRPCVFGYTPDGRYIVVIYEEVDEDTVIPVTAYEVPEP